MDRSDIKKVNEVPFKHASMDVGKVEIRWHLIIKMSKKSASKSNDNNKINVIDRSSISFIMLVFFH